MTAPSPYAPGYREPDAPEPNDVRPATLVAADVVISTALLCALVRELLYRAPQAYLLPLEVSSVALGVAVSLGAALGSWIALVSQSSERLAARTFALAGAAAVLIPWSYRWAFGVAAQSKLGLLASIFLATTSASLAAVAKARWLRREARDLGLTVELLSPWRLAQSALVLALALAAPANLPALHAGALLGACLALHSLGTAQLARYLAARLLPKRRPEPLALATLLGAALCAFFAERALPLTEAQAFNGQVVATAGGERQRMALVSLGSHFELYVDRALRLSALDAERYPEALVHPARLAAKTARRALLLGGGVGLVERELLRDVELEELTVVVTDFALVELIQRAPWPGESARSALRDPRVKLVEAEPIVFVERTKERYDLILLDVDDPIGYREAKHYTRYFYRRVIALLTPEGVLAVQLPSPLTFPKASATVLATLTAVGLDPLPYRAALPALGEWGFALAAPGTSSQALHARVEAARHRLPRKHRYVTPETLSTLFARPLDLPNASGTVSTLFSPTIVDAYARENETR